MSKINVKGRQSAKNRQITKPSKTWMQDPLRTISNKYDSVHNCRRSSVFFLKKSLRSKQINKQVLSVTAICPQTGIVRNLATYFFFVLWFFFFVCFFFVFFFFWFFFFLFFWVGFLGFWVWVLGDPNTKPYKNHYIITLDNSTSYLS